MEVIIIEIEEAVNYIEMILNRKLEPKELLAVALAYQQGLLEGSKRLSEVDKADV